MKHLNLLVTMQGQQRAGKVNASETAHNAGNPLIRCSDV